MNNESDVAVELRALANPFLTPSALPPLVEEARRKRASRLVGELLEEVGAELDDGLRAIATVLLASVPGATQARSVHIDRALASLASATRGAPLRATIAVARAALFLSSGGVAVELDATLAERTRFVWHGYVLPPAVGVRLRRAEPEVLELELPRTGTCTIARADLPRTPRAVPLPSIALGGQGRAGHLVLPWAVDAFPELAIDAPLSPLSSEEVRTHVESGWRLLAAASPEHERWCAGVATDIVALDGRGGASRSGSNSDWPGQIALSVPGPPALVAELLVHECTHQYFSLARELGALDDGTDETLYWSPLKRTGRPVGRILLAHHASVNIVMFHRRLIARGFDRDGFSRANVGEHERCVRELEVGLEATGALTSLGRALFVPLAEALA